ncbi:hypothetical protein M378DRAFT_167566 [Amanita muscaria Koide BX008]|uniref:Uncharacterized protein n=1 Tax=Amanita muscaria (strain Koide BX008) TaxID=946122 RepID=A0A0C2WX00_AMAMK|nr:hypothetical protein M378DRAFT_167566 [Amanita muscaria Koide BX008]
MPLIVQVLHRFHYYDDNSDSNVPLGLRWFTVKDYSKRFQFGIKFDSYVLASDKPRQTWREI